MKIWTRDDLSFASRNKTEYTRFSINHTLAFWVWDTLVGGIGNPDDLRPGYYMACRDENAFTHMERRADPLAVRRLHRDVSNRRRIAFVKLSGRQDSHKSGMRRLRPSSVGTRQSDPTDERWSLALKTPRQGVVYHLEKSRRRSPVLEVVPASVVALVRQAAVLSRLLRRRPTSGSPPRSVIPAPAASGPTPIPTSRRRRWCRTPPCSAVRAAAINRVHCLPAPAAAGECRPWMLPSESWNIAQPPQGSVRGPSVTSTSRFLSSSAVL